MKFLISGFSEQNFTYKLFKQSEHGFACNFISPFHPFSHHFSQLNTTVVSPFKEYYNNIFMLLQFGKPA